MHEDATPEHAVTNASDRRGPVLTADLIALFAAGLICHLVPLAVYMLLASGLEHAATAFTHLHTFWPVFLGMAGVAAVQSMLWSKIPPGRPYLLGSCFGRGFLVEAPAIVTLLLVPGWLLLAPFFLMGGLAACLAAAAVIDRRRDVRVLAQGRERT